MKLRTLLPAAVLALAGCVEVESTPKITANVKDWRDEIIYQIVVDRFEDGDPNNNFNVDYDCHHDDDVYYDYFN